MAKHPSNTPLSEWSKGWLRMECVSILEEEPGKDVTRAFAEASKMTTEQMRDMVRQRSSRHGDIMG